MQSQRNRELHAKVKDITYKKSNLSGGIIKDKESKLSILKRDWPGGLSIFVELYENNSKDDNLDDNEYSDLENETLILISELRISLEKLAKKKEYQTR